MFRPPPSCFKQNFSLIHKNYYYYNLLLKLMLQSYYDANNRKTVKNIMYSGKISIPIEIRRKVYKYEESCFPLLLLKENRVYTFLLLVIMR